MLRALAEYATSARFENAQQKELLTHVRFARARGLALLGKRAEAEQELRLLQREPG